MLVASVVGTRPQLIKAACLQPVLRSRLREVFIDTGQHWDDAMAGAFFRELGLARPDHSLGIGGGTRAEQIGRMVLDLEPIFRRERPDAVLVFGDTNSTIAGALAGATAGLPVAHVEAGLRSFDRRMPEELNRIVTDHVATWLFAPTPTAVANLAAEGITEGVTLVGDLMQDLAAQTLPQVRDVAVLAAVVGPRPGRPAKPLQPGRYLYATLHRSENREPDAIARWSWLLQRVARPDRPVALSLHPGTRRALGRTERALGPDVLILGPQTYRASLALQLHAAAVLTDSGGIQREAAWLGVPCLVLRSTSEWVEALSTPGTLSVLVGLDAERAAVELERLAPLATTPALARRRSVSADITPAGAANAITEALAAVLQRQRQREARGVVASGS